MKNAMVVGISVLLLLCFSSVLVSATWCDNDYGKKAPILINNTDGSAQTYYQVMLNYTYDSDMNANFSDARVYNESDCSLVPLWNESAVDGSWNKIWFNATNIPGSTWTNDTYYLYYDYSSASSVSNVSNTFLFGDDFNNLDNWITDSGIPSITNGILSLDGTGAVIYNNVVRGPYGIAMRQRTKVQGTNYCFSGMFKTPSGWVQDDCFQEYRYNNGLNFGTWDDSTGAWEAAGSMDSAYHILEMQWLSGNAKLYKDDVLAKERTSNVPNEATKVALRGLAYWDWVLIRKYNDSEPTAQLGTEESQPPSGPTLNIGNAVNIKYDWGQDWSSNFSANVTNTNTSNVWMNFTNAEFTNTSLGNLNITIDEWVNQSHNVATPVTNVSVTVTLNSTTSGATNDTDTFWYEITKRTNIATMDSDATQSKYEDENFFIYATCNEEYGDTFYGSADLFEDGAIVSTNNSVINSVSFLWSESVVGQYNYTVRFYNLSYYNNVTTPTYTNVTVSPAPYNTTIYKGYNLVGYTGTDDGSAEVLVTDIDYSNYITVLEKTVSDYFRTHTKGFSINNFTTEHGYGYYIFATSESIYEREGFLPFSYNTTLETGWNIIGWSNSTEIDAEQLSNLVGGNCSYVADLNPNRGIIIHTKGFSSNNFNVIKGRAYFMHVNKAMGWARNA